MKSLVGLVALAVALVASVPARACPFNAQVAVAQTVIVPAVVPVATVVSPVVQSQVVVPTVVGTPFFGSRVGGRFARAERLAAFGAGSVLTGGVGGGIAADLATFAGEELIDRAIFGRGAGFGGGFGGRGRNINSNNVTNNTTNNITRAPKPAPVAKGVPKPAARPAGGKGIRR